MPQRPISSVISKRRVITGPPTMPVLEAARQMKELRLGSVLVVDHGRLVGIFTERDAVYRVMAEGRDAAKVTVGEVMTAHPQTIGPDKPVGMALLMMHEGGYRHVPVVSHGKPLGMITARDALGPELRDFESELERRKRIGEVLG